MYIVWRRRPIRTDRRAELFVAYDGLPGRDAARRVLNGGRRKVGGSQGGPAWKPLFCDHKGPGRLACTPLLVHSRRDGGSPRQEALYRFPTIRTCCLQDPFLLAAWWYDVRWNIGYFEQSNDGPVSDFIARDKRALLAKLREVVPPPTRRGSRKFTAYRLQKEGDQERDRNAFIDALRRQAEEDARREQEARRSREEFFQAEGAFAGGNPADDCWAVLGLRRTATLEEVKARYRALLMEHHPDREGDKETCQKIMAAYAKACRTFAGRG
jgi:hypothetical protein